MSRPSAWSPVRPTMGRRPGSRPGTGKRATQKSTGGDWAGAAGRGSKSFSFPFIQCDGLHLDERLLAGLSRRTGKYPALIICMQFLKVPVFAQSTP